MIEIPTDEPTLVYAGTTVTWKRQLADYPAPTWTLRYYLLSATERIALVATADGSDHLVSAVPATTARWTAGRYTWTAYASDGSATYWVDEGVVEVKPDLQAANPLDLRTHARKVLEAIEALIEGSASKEQRSLAVAGRSLERRSLEELRVMRSHYRSEVQREEAANRGNRSSMRKVFVRFGQPS